jgi:alpha-L-fucosidase
LLVNIPPDKRGLVHETDIKSLLQWKRLRDASFKTNLAKDATVSSFNGKGINKLLDKNNATHFTTTGNDTTSIIEFDFKSDKTFDILLLRENIRLGQRVERFVLEYLSAGEWKKAAEGRTIGYKRLLRFGDVTASKVRLKVLSSRLNPFISEFGLYKQGSLNR